MNYVLVDKLIVVEFRLEICFIGAMFIEALFFRSFILYVISKQA